MEWEKHIACIGGRLRQFTRELNETPGRELDAEAVARMLAEFDGSATATGEPLGLPLSIWGLRVKIAGVRGAEVVTDAIDAALADGVD